MDAAVSGRRRAGSPKQDVEGCRLDPPDPAASLKEFRYAKLPSPMLRIGPPPQRPHPAATPARGLSPLGVRDRPP
jgi:hypothetical protein